MMWSYAAYSDIGTRTENEDDYCITDKENRLCVTLADGLGGHGGGRTAAQTVVRKISGAFTESCESGAGDAEQHKEEMIRAIHMANTAVVELQTPQCRLQATCVSLWLEDTDTGCDAVWAHVGDSRLYCFVDGKLVLKSKDHSLKELWKDDPVKKHIDVMRNIVWQAVGEEAGVKPDVCGPVRLNGKRTAFLICSDGVWEYISDRKLASTLRRSKTPEQWLEKLRELVQKRSGESLDNNTAAAVFIDQNGD